MDNYLVELIERMCDDSDQIMVPGYDSSKTISWKATREAEKLTEAKYITELIQFIPNEKNKKKRSKAYFVLSKIAKNIGSIEATKFLIKRTEIETDKHILMSMFDRLADLQKPCGTDITNILKATESKIWQIRQSAITALKNTEDELAELHLLKLLDSSMDKFDYVRCISTLYYIGTRRAIPHLEKFLSSRTRDIRQSAEFAIKNIETRIESTNA